MKEKIGLFPVISFFVIVVVGLIVVLYIQEQNRQSHNQNMGDAVCRML
jgi:Na+/proline symporter